MERKEYWEPSFLQLELNSFRRKVEQARHHLECCDLCPRYCRVNRTVGIQGAVCRTGERSVVNSVTAHHGEEGPISGWRGSGTIFFSWCNLRCTYCQNWEISQKGLGREISAGELAAAMLELQERGCHNINLVTPSHVVAQVIEAVFMAREKGLRVPLVYNTGGYDSTEALRLLDGVIDIYMPDMKYGASGQDREYSKVRDYVEFNRATVLEMYRQVGDLVMDENGLARRGLLIRHLVLPGGLSGTEEVLKFIAERISRRTYLNLMFQYRPCFQAHRLPPLDRRLAFDEYDSVLQCARNLKLTRVHRQEMWV